MKFQMCCALIAGAVCFMNASSAMAEVKFCDDSHSCPNGSQKGKVGNAAVVVVKKTVISELNGNGGSPCNVSKQTGHTLDTGHSFEILLNKDCGYQVEYYIAGCANPGNPFGKITYTQVDNKQTDFKLNGDCASGTKVKVSHY